MDDAHCHLKLLGNHEEDDYPGKDKSPRVYFMAPKLMQIRQLQIVVEVWNFGSAGGEGDTNKFLKVKKHQ